ncbi:hypothetical protein EUX98_g2309 [Antrodiella citrinella]|uniref:Uncharacterized protein n=1 Tax=Antrodiella citrinella TaxID=2447956 RepID=A0A4V3XJ60_9APHY|nr:hypothetical protein EUX98_g2309 [Antrodiella citrinella]
MYEDDMDLYFDMPGGDDFEDVTELFDVAASDMTSGQVILTDGFTLLDGMSAFEIGEPRMDSGMIHEQVRKPPFDPLTPLLPQELCWILDRSFACEMEWHAGNTLSQTVYTLLYVHSLPQIDPELIQYPTNGQALRAFEGMITIALRSAVIGLLKCCDLTWLQLPSQTATWDSIDCLLQGWEILDHLLSSHSIFAWDVSGTMCTTFHKTLPPYIRSLIQSALQDRNHVFGVYPNLWLVEHYFSETLGISYEAITHTMRVHWDSTGTFSTKELERQVLTPLVNHLRSHWYSPPRRRRYLMTSVVEWQIVQDGFRSLASQLIIEDDDTDAIINAFLATPCLWKTSTAREIILSGFQQELYASEEIPVAYWYTAEVLKIHLSLLDVLKEAVPEGARDILRAS